MPPFPHLTSCTPTKSNLHLANPLATVVSDPDLYRLLIFHAPNLMSLFHCCGRTKRSVQVPGTCICFVSMPVFTVRSYQHLAQPPSWSITPCQLSATTYSFTTCGRAMLWWQGPTYHGYIYIYIYAPPRFSRPGLTNLLYPCPKWHAEMFPWHPALFAVPIFLNLFFTISFSKFLRICTVIPRLTKIIRSGITFVSRNLR